MVDKPSDSKRGPSASFREKRKSYVPNVFLRRSESARKDSERISIRHRSRAYSMVVNPADILNPQGRIVLEWKDLGFTVQPRRTPIEWLKCAEEKRPMDILNGLNGRVKPGQLVGVMGPNGSGKSTLLKLLAGRVENGKVSGQILANGLPRTKFWRFIVGLVEQDTGYLDPRLTVREQLDYISKLVVPKKYGEAERNLKIEYVMKMMGITHIADSTIGAGASGSHEGISGGERKRLAVAIELLLEPKVLLLDEPTTGLDAKTANDIVRYLYQLAVLEDLTIIMTVHQPRISILTKFDSLIIILKGRSIFNGTVDKALEHFEQHGFTCPDDENPAEFFIQSLKPSIDSSGNLSIDNGENMIRAWKEYEGKLHDSDDKGSRQIRANSSIGFTSRKQNQIFYREFTILLRRYLDSFFRDKEYMWSLNLLCFVGFFLVFPAFFQLPLEGFASVQNRLGFICSTSYHQTAVPLMITLVHNNAYSIRRERSEGVARSGAYYAALLVAQIPVWLITMFVLMIILYYTSAMRYAPFTALLIFLGLQILLIFQALAVGFIISATSPNLKICLTIGIFYIFFFTVFDGVAANTNDITWILRWIRYISPLYYFDAGISQNEFIGQTINGEPGVNWINQFALNAASLMWCAGALMIITAVSLVAGFLCFKHKTKPNFQV